MFWDTKSGRQLGILSSDKESNFPSSGLAFSPDGLLIGSSNGMSVILINISDFFTKGEMQPQIVLRPHPAFIRNIKFSPDGIIIASRDDQGIIQLWDRSTNQVSVTFQGDIGGPGDIVFSPDGTILASSNIRAGKSIESHPGLVN